MSAAPLLLSLSSSRHAAPAGHKTCHSGARAWILPCVPLPLLSLALRGKEEEEEEEKEEEEEAYISVWRV